MSLNRSERTNWDSAIPVATSSRRTRTHIPQRSGSRAIDDDEHPGSSVAAVQRNKSRSPSRAGRITARPRNDPFITAPSTISPSFLMVKKKKSSSSNNFGTMASGAFRLDEVIDHGERVRSFNSTGLAGPSSLRENKALPAPPRRPLSIVSQSSKKHKEVTKDRHDPRHHHSRSSSTIAPRPEDRNLDQKNLNIPHLAAPAVSQAELDRMQKDMELLRKAAVDHKKTIKKQHKVCYMQMCTINLLTTVVVVD